MYPRNSASPEPVAIGPVVQISDGAVQTAGVTVRVKPIGVAEADGGGTTAYSTDGVVLYTPTQAETNYTSFVLIAKKTGCIPASVTVVTSASNTPGYAGTDQSKILNPSSTVNLSGTSIKTATDVETDTQDIQTRLPSGLVDGRMASIAQVVGDKTGYKLASDGLSLVTAWAVGITGNITGNVTGSVGSVTGNVGGNVSGSVGSIAGVTFPTHFDNLAIAPNGHVTSTVDSINNNAITASSIQANAITSAKIASGAITSAAFANDSITASALATDAVNEIANAVGQLTAIVDLGTMIINDGTANARYSVSALQNGPSGAGGSTINVYPVSASTPERVAGTTITFYRDENRAVSVVTDFVLDALTLEFVVEDSEGTDLLVIPDGSISKSNKTFTVTIGTTVTATISNYRWSLRDITSGSNSVIARGVLSVQEAASNG